MIISNATPLIYLAKVQQLELLKKIFGKVVITPEVKQEVVDRGKALQKPDAFLIEREIEKGWIIVKESTEKVVIVFDIHPGEKSVIALAKSLSQKVVLMDEMMGRKAAQLSGLTPRGTVYVLLEALKKRHLTFDQFITILDTLANEGFRLREEIYTKAMEKAREISKNRSER